MQRSHTDGDRNSRMAIVAGTLLTLALIILFGTFYAIRRAQARPRTTAEILARDRERVIELNAERAKQAEKLVPMEVDELRAIRERWRPWVTGHSALISAMSHAAPGDYRAMDAIYSALPVSPGPDAPLSVSEYKSLGFKISWNRAPDHLTATDPVLRDKEQKGLNSARTWRVKDFDKFHDVRFLSAIGPPEVALWASGRITRKDFGVQYEPKYSFATSSETEIEPPFDHDSR